MGKSFVWARVLYGQELCMGKSFVWARVLYGQELCMGKSFVWARVLYGQEFCMGKSFVWARALYGQELVPSHDMPDKFAYLIHFVCFWVTMSVEIVDEPGKYVDQGVVTVTKHDHQTLVLETERIGNSWAIKMCNVTPLILGLWLSYQLKGM